MLQSDGVLIRELFQMATVPCSISLGVCIFPHPGSGEDVSQVRLQTVGGQDPNGVLAPRYPTTVPPLPLMDAYGRRLRWLPRGSPCTP